MHQLLSLRTKIWIVVGIAALVAGLARWTGLGALSMGAVVGVVEFVLLHVLMRSWEPLHRLSWLPLPAWAHVDLTGQWQGTIQSQWKKHPEDAALAPIPATLDLRQGWQEIVFSLKTGKMRSRSSAAHPTFDPTMNEIQFRYFYETMPTAEANDANPPQRLGSALARVALDQPDRMTITYTNERSTGGDIILERVPSKSRVRRLKRAVRGNGTDQSKNHIHA
jgi:hypothetical protein